MKGNKPSPPVTGTIEISHSEHGVFIGGAPEGLRSIGRLLRWLADVNQETVEMPDWERTHVHLHPGPSSANLARLTVWSEDTEVCRLDAKGTGDLPFGPFRGSQG